MTRCAAPRKIRVSEENPEKCEKKTTGGKNGERRKNSASCKEPTECKMRDECRCHSKKKEIVKQKTSDARYDVFLGGSCGTTVWRRQLVIPFLKNRSISYYDPQRSAWSENMIYEESIAKENSSLFLFVIDPATVNATSFLEIAYFAARKSPKLVVVFLGKTEWAEKAHPNDLPDRNRTCQLLDRILEAHEVPMLHNIPDALDFIEEEMLGRKDFKQAMSETQNRIPYLTVRARRAARKVKHRTSTAVTSLLPYASRATVAGVIDTVAIILAQLFAPNVPLFYVLVPLLLINMAVFGITSRWKRYAKMKYARVAASETMPINSVGTTDVSRKSKHNFEKLVTDDGSASFTVPKCISQRLVKMAIDCQAIEMCSSSLNDNSWVHDVGSPLLDRNHISYSYVLAMPLLMPEVRMNCLRLWQPHHKKFFYYIPTTATFLSGMVEVAYILGHSDWQATICVPQESQILDGPEECNDEKEGERLARRRRNDCYQIAFCYLKDMAKRRQCRVFNQLDSALRYLVDQSLKGL